MQQPSQSCRRWGEYVRTGRPQSAAGTLPVDVSVCIVNWNCCRLLKECLESLHDQAQGVNLETIVVDNASSDGAADMVAALFPEAILWRNPSNVGFARGNNQAAALAHGRYLFFLNNDTLVPPQTLRRLFDYAQAHPEIGMLGPRMQDGEGKVQISYRPRPTLAALLHHTTLFRCLGLLHRSSPLSARRLRSLHHTDRGNPHGRGSVSAP